MIVYVTIKAHLSIIIIIIVGENRSIGLDMYPNKILTVFYKFALQTVWQEDKLRNEKER